MTIYASILILFTILNIHRQLSEPPQILSGIQKDTFFFVLLVSEPTVKVKKETPEYFPDSSPHRSPVMTKAPSRHGLWSEQANSDPSLRKG